LFSNFRVSSTPRTGITARAFSIHSVFITWLLPASKEEHHGRPDLIGERDPL
jgi:hypothetical protein